MVEATERLFAQYTLLNYLQQSNSARTATEILNHLHQHTDWGERQLDNQVSDNGLQNLQKWLKEISKSPEFGGLIESEADTSNRKQNIYRAIGNKGSKQTIPVEDACFILMAEEFLDAALPTDFYDASLQDLFTRAWDSLKRYEKNQKNQPQDKRKAISTFLDRIAFVPRGQQLVKQPTPHDIMAVVYRAILEKRRLKMRYRGKPREIHPYGVLIREPKIYLLGVDDKDLKKTGARNPRPFPFLCNRIEQPTVGQGRNKVPDDFTVKKFITEGGLDIGLREQAGLSHRHFTLKLRIYPQKDNLLQDLEEFPLSSKQTIAEEPDTKNHILVASGMQATHQLVEWILGRQDRIEVLAPTKLRDYIAARIARMHQRYVE